MSRVSSSDLLHVMVREGLDAPLLPLGFKPTNRRLTWSRPARELIHLVGLLATRKRYTVQWSIGCPPAARLLWGEGDAGDISYCVMSGAPSDLTKPSFANGFGLDDDVTEDNVHHAAAALAADITAVAVALERFQSVGELWRYLMANRDPVDHRDFAFPELLPMKIAAATALAMSAGDRAGCALMPEARAALTSFNVSMRSSPTSA